MVGPPSFSQYYLYIKPPLTITTKKPFFYISQFSSPCSTLNCSQNRSFNPYQQFLSLYVSNLSPLYFCVLPSQQSTPKIFSPPHPFSQFRLHQGIKELGTLVRIDTVLISPFLFKGWTAVTRLTITDPLSLITSCVGGKPFNPPSLIPLICCHYYHALLIPSQELKFL